MSRQETLDGIKGAFGMVPGFLEVMDDQQLAGAFGALGWGMSDTALTAREKALVAYGASAAYGCRYWVPFHSAQLGMMGVSQEQMTEAARATANVGMFRTFLSALNYPMDKFNEELAAVGEHLSKQG